MVIVYDLIQNSCTDWCCIFSHIFLLTRFSYFRVSVLEVSFLWILQFFVFPVLRHDLCFIFVIFMEILFYVAISRVFIVSLCFSVHVLIPKGLGFHVFSPFLLLLWNLLLSFLSFASKVQCFSHVIWFLIYIFVRFYLWLWFSIITKKYRLGNHDSNVGDFFFWGYCKGKSHKIN